MSEHSSIKSTTHSSSTSEANSPRRRQPAHGRSNVAATGLRQGLDYAALKLVGLYNKTNLNTPSKGHMGASGGVQSLGSTAQERAAGRLAVADCIIKDNLHKDDDRVFSMAEPIDAAAKAKATTIIEVTAQAMERLRNLDHTIDEAYADHSSITELDSKLGSFIPGIIRWTQKTSGSSTPPRESSIYSSIAEFVLFVACCVRYSTDTEASVPENDGSTDQRRAGPRLILPGSSYDFQPTGIEDAERVDVVLGACSFDTPVAPQPIKDYADMFGIIEVKRSRGFEKALSQLLVYSRNLYAWQGNRRYLWGLTVCNTEVHAYLMLNDAVHMSPAMDVTTADGRRGFISLLVHWSLCLEDQLGYDPTIRRIGDTKQYEIDCADDEDIDGAFSTYVTKMSLKSADSIIGRHTRCYVARLKATGEHDNVSGEIDVTDLDVVIKDAWPPASMEHDLVLDPRSEILLMRTIAAKLEGKEHDLMYPKLLIGGH
ncbi:hypothetical protein COEREDRAFT_12707, partial [Coemansia reversa NRRL 1564]